MGIMKDINVDVRGITITSVPYQKHYFITVTANESFASQLYETLGNQIEIELDKDSLINRIFFSFKLLDRDETFKLDIEINEQTLTWLDWIKQGLVTELFVAYPQQNGQHIYYGQAKHPLFLSRQGQ